MCLAIPGKIIKTKQKTAIVKYPNEKQEVMLDPNIPVEKGDRVLVQMGVIIERLENKKTLKPITTWEK